MENFILSLRGLLGLGVPKSEFTRLIAALNKENYYHARKNILIEIYNYWNNFNQEQAEQISTNLAKLVEEGRFIKNTDYNKVLHWLIEKSKLIANSMIDASFKNKVLPDSKFTGCAIYAFVIMPIVIYWPRLVEEKVKNGELPNEWLTLGK